MDNDIEPYFKVTETTVRMHLSKRFTALSMEVHLKMHDPFQNHIPCFMRKYSVYQQITALEQFEEVKRINNE